MLRPDDLLDLGVAAPKMHSSSSSSETSLAPASTITIASSVPATTRSRSETSRWLLVGLMTTCAVDQPDAHRADRVVERDVGEDQRRSRRR